MNRDVITLFDSQALVDMMDCMFAAGGRELRYTFKYGTTDDTIFSDMDLPGRVMLFCFRVWILKCRTALRYLKNNLAGIKSGTIGVFLPHVIWRTGGGGVPTGTVS